MASTRGLRRERSHSEALLTRSEVMYAVAVAAALAAGGPAERMPIDLPTDAAIERLGEDARAATDTAQMVIAKHARAMTVRKKIHHASEANEAALKVLVQSV